MGTATQLPDLLLQDYVHQFFGYGSYGGDWWLIGMEEGGGNNVEEVATRLRLWDQRGRRELEDVDMFESSPELAKWFTARPPLQPTWRGLARMILAAGDAAEKHFSSDHRLFSAARWSLDALGLALFDLIEPFLGKVVMLGLDDTLARKRGLKMFGTGMHHDPLLSSRGKAITNVAGDPNLRPRDERALRRELINKALKALTTPVNEPTAFD